MTIPTLQIPYPKPLLILSCVLGFLAITQVFTINLTSSMPLGIYFKSYGAIQRGDIVVACVPEPHKSIALKAGYLDRSAKCNGSDPIIKEVIAVPGDNVVLKNKSITVNHRNYFYPTKAIDSQGRKLNFYSRDDYQKTNGYWLIGTNDIEHSWDSRYWGPISRYQILNKLRPLFTW